MSSKLNEFQNATVGMTVGVIGTCRTSQRMRVERSTLPTSRKCVAPVRIPSPRSCQYVNYFAWTSTIEVLLLQPFNYAKNMTQQKQPISLNPMVMYRGVHANALNMGSCTMIQFAVGGRIQQFILNGEQRHLSLKEEMTAGIGGGTVSGLVGSPLELIMIQQQRKGLSLGATIADITRNPPNVMRGFVGCAIREALWTCGYLSIPPVVRRSLMETYPETYPDNNRARIPAALLGGLFACYLTHPFDTVKTCMQGDIERTTYGTFTQTAGKIFAESSIPGFYRGATFRYGRMVCAVFIMDLLKEQVGYFLYPQAFA